MYYTIYQITNEINGKIYIGKHQTKKPNDSYYGSGKAILASIQKYGKENFKKEILFVFETEAEMNQKEKELISEEFILRQDTYNLGVGGEGGAHFKGKKHSAETIERVNRNPEFVKKRVDTIKAKYQSGELEAWNKNKKLSEETKQKISETMTGSTRSEETKNKISASITGKKHSEETKQKMREAKKRRYNLSGPVD